MGDWAPHNRKLCRLRKIWPHQSPLPPPQPREPIRGFGPVAEARGGGGGKPCSLRPVGWRIKIGLALEITISVPDARWRFVGKPHPIPFNSKSSPRQPQDSRTAPSSHPGGALMWEGCGGGGGGTYLMWGGGGDVLEEMGGGGWNPEICVPKIAQINSFCKFYFFPL